MTCSNNIKAFYLSVIYAAVINDDSDEEFRPLAKFRTPGKTKVSCQDLRTNIIIKANSFRQLDVIVPESEDRQAFYIIIFILFTAVQKERLETDQHRI